MKKQEKIDILEEGIRNVELCSCNFVYDKNYSYYYFNAINEKFVLGQEEDDFSLDGYCIRKISHLKKVKIKNGKYNEINHLFGITTQIKMPDVDITNWKSIFDSLKAYNKVIIIEDEINNQFAIGMIDNVLKNKLYFKSFDVDGVWNADLEIPFSEITTVRWDTRYSDTWDRYLKKKNCSGLSGGIL